mgnify:CR=1 FL=1
MNSINPALVFKFFSQPNGRNFVSLSNVPLIMSPVLLKVSSVPSLKDIKPYLLFCREIVTGSSIIPSMTNPCLLNVIAVLPLYLI